MPAVSSKSSSSASETTGLKKPRVEFKSKKKVPLEVVEEPGVDAPVKKTKKVKPAALATEEETAAATTVVDTTRSKKSKTVQASEEVAAQVVDETVVPTAKKQKSKKTHAATTTTTTTTTTSTTTATDGTSNGAGDATATDSKYKVTDPLASSFRISAETLALLAERGYTHLFPIQAQTFDLIYDGQDLIGRAETGSGKTLAFALPIIERLKAAGPSGGVRAAGRGPLVIVLSPTRELAKQTAKEFEDMAPKLFTCCAYGGVAYNDQVRQLRSGIDVLVGTPGRIIDYIESGSLKLDRIAHVVLDETDQMLDFGFAGDIEKILGAIPAEKEKQTVLFSATLPKWVSQEAKKYLKSGAPTIDLIQNRVNKSAVLIKHNVCLVPYGCNRGEVLASLCKVYRKTHDTRTIIFANSKAGANELALASSLANECQVLHGDIPQAQREISLSAFRDGRYPVLVATDVAARGLDITGVDLVLMDGLPKNTESYLHRAGRTGRAGREGTVICLVPNSRRGISEMQVLQQRGGIKFDKVPVPTPADLMEATSSWLITSINAIDHQMVPLFAKSAQTLLDNFDGDATKAIALLLAKATGYTQPVTPRSLLGADGKITMLMSGLPYSWKSISHICGAIKQHVPELTDNDITSIAICKDGSAIFDVTDKFADKCTTSSKYIKIATELPETYTNTQEYFQSNGGGYQRGGNNGYRYNNNRYNNNNSYNSYGY